MLRKGSSNRVGFRPDISEKPMISHRYSFDAKVKRHKQAPRRIASSPRRLFRYVRTTVVKAIHLVTKRRPLPASRASTDTLVVPLRFVSHRDSHHSENLEDCIQFINSSYRRSNLELASRA